MLLSPLSSLSNLATLSKIYTVHRTTLFFPPLSEHLLER